MTTGRSCSLRRRASSPRATCSSTASARDGDSPLLSLPECPVAGAPGTVGVLAGDQEVSFSGAGAVDDPGEIVVVVVEAGGREHEMVNGFAGGEVVECDCARGRCFVDVAGSSAFLIWVHVDSQLGGVDEPVTPHASLAGEDEPGDGVNLAYVAGCFVDGDLDARLGGRDEVLVGDGVDPVPGGVAVGGQEDPVAHRERQPGVRVLNSFAVDREADVRVGPAGVPGGDLRLRLIDVAGFRGNEPGQVRAVVVDVVVVDEDEVADAEAGEEFDDYAADSAE